MRGIMPPDAIQLPSQFQPLQIVNVFGQSGTIRRVSFSESKVTYDIALTQGGEVLQNVDSAFVTA